MVEFVFGKILQWAWIVIISMAIICKIALWILDARDKRRLDKRLDRPTFYRRPWK